MLDNNVFFFFYLFSLYFVHIFLHFALFSHGNQIKTQFYVKPKIYKKKKEMENFFKKKKWKERKKKEMTI